MSWARDGGATARWQEGRARGGLKILYTTGHTRNAIVHNGMRDPGVHFLPKPFTFGQLATKVRQMLDGQDQIIPAPVS